MSKVYVVVKEGTETLGHGYSGSFLKLAKYGESGYGDDGHYYPVFLKQEDAEIFINEKNSMFRPKIVELPII